jgi:hypothetical protein
MIELALLVCGATVGAACVGAISPTAMTIPRNAFIFVS